MSTVLLLWAEELSYDESRIIFVVRQAECRCSKHKVAIVVNLLVTRGDMFAKWNEYFNSGAEDGLTDRTSIVY